MRSSFAMFTAIAMAATLAAGAASALTCKTGYACGGKCIPKDQVCHQPMPRRCTTGKPCADACIPANKACPRLPAKGRGTP